MTTPVFPIGPVTAQQQWNDLAGQPSSKSTLTTNPAFDKRLFQNYPLTQNSIIFNQYDNLPPGNVAKGFLLQAQANGNTRYGLNFLYNPTTYYETRALDTSNTPLPSVARSSYDTGSFLAPLNSTMSFSLLFDRTYELWEGSNAASSVLQQGTMADCQILYAITGITTTNTQWTQGTTSANATYNASVYGPMTYTPVFLYFSRQSLIYYYGIIEEMDITWSHFTGDMLPARCEVDISMSLLPLTSQPAGTSGY